MRSGSNSSKLRIGFSSCFFHADPMRALFKGKLLLYVEQSIAHWVMREGALAYLIPDVPASGAVSLGDLLDGCDGVVLQGGSDVSPKSYGETALKPEWNGDYIRDQYEIEIVKTCLARNKPLLGICRGAQLLNVALGGTLYQDINTQVTGSLVHRDWKIYDQNFHAVRLAPGSHLGKLYPGVETAKINTVHHQGVKNLGRDLVVEATCPDDGIIEAIRVTGNAYAAAVQWHPEFQDPNDGSLLDTRPLLRDFLNAAYTRRQGN